MSNLLSVTGTAAKQIKKILCNAPDKTDSIVVGVDKSGCSGYSYKIDFVKSADLNNYEFVKVDDFKIYIDPKATIFLVGSVMDYKVDKISSRFIFKNPNETSTCGCGESFTV
tara:strand:+ start:568 stop:903 length:336 start_codon:yes stop_codon:yes gene_type:complete